ncbi:MAG: uroporphyrinogen-III synthase [Candidatus Bathyarchaeota archaeon]|nr:uroporphyrinogen-III synthase [Candidatus Bathyarchaeota archaeon]
MVQEGFTLKGRTIVITRPREQAEETAKLIKERGGEPYFFSTIEIKNSNSNLGVKKFVEALEKGEVDYVIFMSVNGVKYLLHAVEKLGCLNQLKCLLEKTEIVAVGPKTAQELSMHQIHVDMIPPVYTSDCIIASLQQRGISGKKIWIPRTKQASPTMAEKLAVLGGSVSEIHVYESRYPRDKVATIRFLKDLAAGRIHAIIFSSSLSAKNLFKMVTPFISEEELHALLSRLTIVAIGPKTAETLVELGLKVDVMPKAYLLEEALSALAQHWSLNQ